MYIYIYPPLANLNILFVTLVIDVFAYNNNIFNKSEL